MIQLLDKIHHKDSKNFFLIAGPCAIEGEEMAFEIAEKIVKLSDKYKIPYIFKGSFKKANRSRVDSFTGIGDEKALEIIKKQYGKYINVFKKVFEPEELINIISCSDPLAIPKRLDHLTLTAMRM